MEARREQVLVEKDQHARDAHPAEADEHREEGATARGSRRRAAQERGQGRGEAREERLLLRGQRVAEVADGSSRGRRRTAAACPSPAVAVLPVVVLVAVRGNRRRRRAVPGSDLARAGSG